MGVSVVNLAEKQMDHQRSQSSSTKVERRIIEKNRRNQMKVLYSRLNSLLPNPDSKEAVHSLPDQIDEAINYITSLETKLKKSKEKKESLMGRKKRPYTCTNFEETAGLKSPKIEIRETGSTLEIVLITGLDNQFIFYEMIHILHGEQAEVLNASFSTSGDSVLHVVHAEIVGCSFDFGAAKVTERLKRLVYGSTSDVELSPDLWDFPINSEAWGF
ncbi:transcription factor bHLH162-like [Juglans microcarpa x Juglans regia]|uniref:transcription factor bHLH162-like n=1 Tax=Juglans microcarpa x Juglans regia TaxID=2249226 RepID=UPI001B7F31EB|nr:transcription factor bHLH162-like [Juglans microcarpa x Juglans regia]